MATASRTVRRLRLRAPSEAAVRRTVCVFEDALRTASLPDGGGRMLLVRRLALGRIDPGAEPSSVALALESAVARVGVDWRHGGEARAGAADAVWFRDPLDAHLALARRLLSGPSPDEWYWTLAVPRWARRSARDDGLREIAFSLAARPEAPAALPRWFGELVGAGHVATLAAALHAEDVEPLARAAGMVLDPAARRSPAGPDRPTASPTIEPGPAGSEPPVARTEPAVHRLIAAMLRVEGGAVAAPGVPGLRDVTPTHEANPGDDCCGDLPIATRLPAGTDALSAATESPAGESTFPPPPVRVGIGAGVGDSSHGSGSDGERKSKPAADLSQSTLPLPRPRSEGTSSGGLLFLLNGLTRIGYAEWLEGQPEWKGYDVARRVLGRILGRLDVPRDDPAWEVVDTAAALPRFPGRFVAPPRWREGLLSGRGSLRLGRSGRGGRLHDASGRLLLGGWWGACPRPLLSACRDAAVAPCGARPLADEVVAAWDVALRRWLRRWARIGVADLVLRPAGLCATPTHVDVRFRLDEAREGIRRAGLDLDPGWLPWLGRVVAFHYEAGGQA